MASRIEYPKSPEIPMGAAQVIIDERGMVFGPAALPQGASVELVHVSGVRVGYRIEWASVASDGSEVQLVLRPEG